MRGIVVNNRIFDAWIVLIFGVVGIIMETLNQSPCTS